MTDDDEIDGQPTESRSVTLSTAEIDRAVRAFNATSRTDAIRQAFRYGLRKREKQSGD